MMLLGNMSLLFAEATGKEVDALEWSPDLAIFTLILFIIFAAVLGMFAWKPITAALDEREKSITDKIEQAEANAAKMESLKRAFGSQHGGREDRKRASVSCGLQSVVGVVRFVLTRRRP